MKLVDSKEQKLSYNQVLLGAIENMKSSGQIPENVSRKDAAAKILQEIVNKNVQTVQIGNSIFVGVYSKEKDNMYKFDFRNKPHTTETLRPLPRDHITIIIEEHSR